VSATLAPLADPMLPRPHRVRDLRPETSDTFTIELSPETADGVSFVAGQFNMLYAFGVGEAPLSISSDPARGDLFAHTTREVGGVTRALGRLRRGDVVGLRGPFGRGWPLDEAEGRDVVLVAGGIGIAPLRSLVYALLGQRSRYRRIALAYGARAPGDVLFADEFDMWRSRGRMDVEVTVDRATESWRGRVGVVTTLLRRFSFDPAETVAFLCGPEIMMRYAAGDLMARDVAPRSIYAALERNMRCAVGLCGHCQLGAMFVCRQGPVFPYDVVGPLLGIQEI